MKIFLLLLFILTPTLAQALPGDLDSQFGNQGQIVTKLGQGSSQGEVVLVASGKVLVAGVHLTNKQNDFALARYDNKGQLDMGFGIGGQITTDLGGHEGVYGLGLQKNGDILVAGYTRRGAGKKAQKDFALVRYQKNGNLDVDFGQNGWVIDGFGGDDEIHYLAIDSKNRIVVAGFSYQQGSYRGIVARYLKDGQKDLSFQGRGFVKTQFSSDDRLYGLSLQKDNKIVVTGSVQFSNHNKDCVIARYHDSGLRDQSFGYGGFVPVAFGPKEDVCAAVTVQKDGKIVVVGHQVIGSSSDFAIARVDSLGNKDLRFGIAGTQRLDFKKSLDIAHAIAVDSKGRLVVAGTTRKQGKKKTFVENFAIARLNPQGLPDKSFGQTGQIVTPFGRQQNSNAETMTIQKDDKVIVAGSSKDGFAIARYNN